MPFFSDFNLYGLLILAAISGVFFLMRMFIAVQPGAPKKNTGIMFGASILFIIALYFFLQLIFDFLSGITGSKIMDLGAISFFFDPGLFYILLLWLGVGIALLVMGLFSLKLKSSMFILMVIVAPLVEEFFYRSILLNLFSSIGFSLGAAILFSSILYAFAIYHIFMNIQNKVIEAFYLPLIGWGIVWCFVALQYGLVFAIILHALVNLTGELTASSKKTKI